MSQTKRTGKLLKKCKRQKYSVNVHLLRRTCTNQRAIHDFIAK